MKDEQNRRPNEEKHDKDSKDKGIKKDQGTERNVEKGNESKRDNK